MRKEIGIRLLNKKENLIKMTLREEKKEIHAEVIFRTVMPVDKPQNVGFAVLKDKS